MEIFINIATGIAIGLLILGIVIYGCVLVGYVFDQVWAKRLVNVWDDHTFEIPMSGIAAFAIVSLLRSQADGLLEFKAFSLEFNGPAGPATLWIVIYLSIVVSFRLLKKREFTE